MRPIILSLATSLFVGLTPMSAQSAVSALTTSAAVGGIIEQLNKSIAQLLDQLDNRVSARSFQLRTELVMLQAELTHSASGLIGKTFGELSKQQQTFFEKVETTIASGQATVSQVDKEIDSLATQVEQVVAQVPFTGAEPRVRRSNPTYIRYPTAGTSDIPVQIEGSFLNHGPISFQIGTIICEVKGQTDSSATFSCPVAPFIRQSNVVTFVSGDLRVTEERSFFQRVGQFFGATPKLKKYVLPVAVVPPSLGAYEIKVTHLVDTEEPANRTGTWGRTNDHCVDRQSFQYNFGPAGPGWRIDVGSIKTTVGCARSGGDHAIRNASEAGFQIESWARNSGNCERVLGRVVSYDARGCSIGDVTWTERKTTTTRKEFVAGTGQLEWGKSVTVSLPPRVEGILVTVKQINGDTITLNQATAAKWFAVVRDAPSTSVVVSPFELSRALN